PGTRRSQRPLAAGSRQRERPLVGGRAGQIEGVAQLDLGRRPHEPLHLPPAKRHVFQFAVRHGHHRFERDGRLPADGQRVIRQDPGVSVGGPACPPFRLFGGVVQRRAGKVRPLLLE
ncbi:MAG: hypothetical protein ACK55I_26445, partial [bacterium]